MAFGSNDDRAYGVAVQPDGRIVVAGETSNGSNFDFAVARLNADGSLDTSFDGDGRVTTAVGTSHDRARGVALQPDGRIVVGGMSTTGSANDFAIARYTPDGSLDTQFRVVNTLDGAPTYTEGGAAVVLDSDVGVFDAELRAAGSYAGATLTLARNGGASTQDLFSATGSLGALTEDGSLVVAGTTIGTVTTNSGGTLVLTFNAGATNTLVNSAMQQIAYANNSDAPPSSVQINWAFSDGNTGAQGAGGALTATGSTTVSITAVNDAPTATIVPASYAANEQVALTLQGTGLSIADIDAGNAVVQATLSVGYGVLTVASGTTGVTVSGSGTGTVTLSGTITQINSLLAGGSGGTLSYTANTDAPPASTTLTLTASDLGNAGSGGAKTGTDTATIDITAVNDAPVFNAASLSVSEGQTVTLSGANFGVTDPDSTTFIYTVSSVSGGYFQFSGNPGVAVTSFTTAQLSGGLVQFVDDGNETAPSFAVTVNDGATDSNTLVATISYTPVNDAPVAASDSAAGNEDTAITGNVLANDSDAENGTLTAALVSGPTHGGLTLDADGSFSYTPDANFHGTDTFTYQASDGSLGSNTATVTITVTPANDAPTTSPVTLTAIAEDSGPRLITQAELLANAGDVDGDSLTATGLTISSGNGSLVDNGDGSWTYTPAANDDTAVSFSYTVSDGTATMRAAPRSTSRRSTTPRSWIAPRS